MNRPAATVVVVSMALSGCGLAMRPVTFDAAPADWKALAGDWRGEYSMDAYDRHGLIAFRLVRGAEAASGDVLMISDGFAWPYQRYPFDPAIAPSAGDQMHVLTIRFVRAEDGDITGRIDRYWDPNRRCDAVASFRGSLDGDTIHGTVSSMCIDNARASISGRWRAERNAAMTPR